MADTVSDKYEELRRFKQHRRSFATAELSDERARRSAPHAWTSVMRISMPCLSRNDQAPEPLITDYKEASYAIANSPCAPNHRQNRPNYH
jgi:hypothetical protein